MCLCVCGYVSVCLSVYAYVQYTCVDVLYVSPFVYVYKFEKKDISKVILTKHDKILLEKAFTA